MTPTLRVGLTGGIGSGKTTVCNFFSELGVPIIDADCISRELVQPGKPGLNTIVEQFGNCVLDNKGQLKRSYLRDVIFNDKQQRQKLESILHPLVYAEIQKQTMSTQSPYCIIAIPLLLETNAQKQVDRILVIDTSIEQQLARTEQRDKVNRQDIEKILNSQIPRESRLEAADDIIVNMSDLESIKKQVEQLHKSYLDMAK